MEDTAAKQISTELVVIFEPGKMTKDNSPLYEDNWRKQMANADIIPQSEDDVKFIRKHQDECLELEGLIDQIFEAAKSGDADISRLAIVLMQ